MKNKNVIGISPMTLVVAAVLIFMSVGIATATVWTDQADYSPGSVVTISGDNSDNAGYQSGETVSISVNGPYNYDQSCNGIANSSGAWSCYITLSSDYTAEGSYIYTAVGQISGVTQSGTFTDAAAHNVNFATSDLPNGVSVAVGWSGTNNGGNSASGTTIFTSPGPSTNQGTRAGTTFTYSFPSSVTSSGQTYNLISSSPVSGFTTGAAGGITTVTATYGLADSTVPTSTIALTPGIPNGNNGWYTSNVHVTVSAVDTGGSGVAEIRCVLDPVNVPITFDDMSAGCAYTGSGADVTTESGHTIYAASKDNANNKEIPTSKSFKIDKTGPSANLAVALGTLGTNGWHTSDVTLSTTGSDSISSPVTCTADQYQTTETTGTTFNGACTNDAGLSTNAAPLTIKLDKTGPSANLAVMAGTLGTNGWYISDVTIATSGEDSIGGPVSCTADQSQTVETTGTIFNGVCTNDAGLSTDATPLTVKLDKTGPTASLSVAAGTLGTNGWYTSDVTVNTLGTDSISSPVICTDDQFQTTETVGTIFNGQCTNDAGISTDAISLTVKLDKTKPVITINSPTATDYILNQNVLADWTATDATSGIFSKTGTVVSGNAIDTGSVGQKTFSVTATDNAGNSDTKSVTYNVIYNFAGFFQPIDNSPAWNVVKAGSAIPVKFSLTGYQGLDIMFQGYPTSNKVDYNGGSLDDVDQTVMAGSSSLTYDVTTDQYIYVWKTDKAWAGTYRQLVVKLKDGTLHLANFKFK